MNRTIILDLPEKMADWLETSAQERGMSPTELIVLTLAEKYRLQHDAGSFEGSAPTTSSPPGPLPNSGRAIDSKAEDARERFRKHFGRLNSADPRSADNQKIDDDLARSYSEHPKDGA